MPSHLRTVRCALLLLAVCALSPLVAQQAHAQAGIEVTVKPPRGSSAAVLTSAIAGEINTTYKVQKGAGVERVQVVKGVSLRQILEETSTNFSYQTIEVPRPDGSTLTITKDQIADPRNQAVFYVDESGVTHFIGPREPGAEAVASQNYFPVTAAMTLTQQAESKLKVTISPDSKKIKPGGTVTFRATVEGNDDDAPLTYTWGLNGRKGTHTTSSTFTKDFPSKDAVYEFLVSVRIAGSGVSTTDVAKITVGDPDKAKQEQVGDGTATDGSSSGTGTGTGTGSSGSGSAYTPSYTPSTPSVTPVPPSTPSTPSTPPPDVPDIATSGTTVEGNLLADVSESPPSSILESAARAAREGKQKSDDSSADGANVSEAALSIVGVLALLAVGAGIETRQGRRPRLRPPRLRRGA